MTPPTPADPKPTGHPAWPGLFVGGVWLVATSALFWLVYTYQSDIPWGDEFDHVPVVTGHKPLSAGWLWSPHNQHRIPLPRLAQLGVLAATGTDFRAGVWVNAAALSGLALATAWAAGRIRGRAAVTDAFFPLVWLNWGHVEIVLFNFGLHFVLVDLLVTAALIVVVLRGHDLRSRDVAVLAACLLLLPLCGGQGLVPAILLAGWLGVVGVTGWRSSRPAAAAVTSSAAVLAVCGLYFVGLSSGGPRPEVSIWERADVALAFLAVGFGPGIGPLWAVGAGAMIGLLAGAVAVGVAGSRRCGEWRRAAGLLAVLAVYPAYAALLGYARTDDGTVMNAGLSSRYSTLWVPGLCAVYFISLVYQPATTGRAVRWGLLAAAVAMQGNYAFGLEYASRYRDRRAAFERELDAGVPSFVLAQRYFRHPFGLFAANPVALDGWLMMLRDAGVGRFARMRPTPPHKSERLGPGNCVVGPEPGRIRLTPGRPVYAARLILKADGAGPGGQVVTLSWRGDGAEGHAEIGVPRSWDEQVVWVGGPVEEFRLESRPGQAPVTIGRVVITVPADGPALPAGLPGVP